MAEQDPLAQSLSEEESELTLTSVQGAAATKKKASISPTQKHKGYKFNADQQKLTSDNFDFASKSKNGQATNNSTSSSEGEDPETFEVLSPDEEAINGDAEIAGKSSTVPLTPSKLPTPPHKRAAELAESGGDALTGANGSPPSSPAPKKRKGWEDFIAEDNAKRQKEKSPEGISTTGRVGKKGKHLMFVFALVVALFGILYQIEGQMQLWNWNPSQVVITAHPPYTWDNASAAFFKDIGEMEKQFPKQNRETWIQLISSISSTLKKTEPEHPAVITVLLRPEVTDEFAGCFVKRVGSVVNNLVAPILQGVNDTKSAKPDPPKILSSATFQGPSSTTDIRADLESYLNTAGKAVLVTNVDKMEKESDLLFFHGLCDNFLAVDKRATVLFLVRVPPTKLEKYEWTHARGGDISTDVLNDAFKKVVSADTGPALVARIADAVILLNDGDKC